MKYALKSIYLLLKKYPYNIIVQVVNILTNVATTIIPIYIIDAIITMYQKDDKNIKDLFVLILIISLIYVACNIINIIITYYNAYIERNFKADLAIMFYQKLDSIDYDFHESPKFLNDYTRALEEGTERIYNTANGVINLIVILFQSLSVFIVIFTMHYLAVVYALVVGIIYMLLRFRVGKLQFKSMTMQRPFFRQRQYVNRTFFIKDAMADLKTTQIEEILLENNEKANDEIIHVIDKVTSKMSILNYIGDVLISSIYPITLGVLVYVTTNLDIATFSALTIAATTLSSLVNQFVTSIADLQNHIVECKIPFEVLNMKSNIEGVKFNDLEGDFTDLKVVDACFSYDGVNNVLSNVNMEIKKGEKIAIVGANGAGKTTLVKLLLRLYDVTSGDIYINGQNYKETTAKALRQKVGAVFQNVEVYAASIAENIIFRKPETEEDINLVNNALKFSGLYDYVNSLEEGINTEVTREFNLHGAIFSGGQMQRIAIARGYAQNYQLFMLDEPSSALDPLAEAQVYQNMLEMGKDKTIIFISHRLTTTVNADCIYLFENGQIIESGSHDELLALNGRYKQMFNSQASKYLGGQYEDN